MAAHNETVISVEGNTIRQLQEKAVSSKRGKIETAKATSVHTAKKKLKNAGQSGSAAAAEIDYKSGATGARDRSHMAAIGRKGGQAVSRDRAHMAKIGRKGGASINHGRGSMANLGGSQGDESEKQSRSSRAKNEVEVYEIAEPSEKMPTPADTKSST